MNDNDIIKALECCQVRECEKCVRRKNGHDEELYCRLVLITDALTIITRKNANIEALEMDNSRLRYKYKMAVEEREANMKGFLEELNRWNKEIQEARAEAIKEFAERLKGMWTIPSPEPYNTDAAEVLDSIDNLVKEMVGERK